MTEVDWKARALAAEADLKAVKGELANTKYVLEEIRAAHDVSVELHLAAEQALSDLKGEVLEKVGPFAKAAWLLVMEPGVSIAICEDDGTELVTDDDFRALSSLHEKLSSIGGSSSTETAASVASDLTAGEAQRTSEWRTIDSAPRDGTYVLGYGPHDQRGAYIDVIHFWGGKWTIVWMHGFGEPTHWRPLPEPPSFEERPG